MSILDLAYGAVPSWLVRLMRALRVVRLFGRVRELRKVSAAVVYVIIKIFPAALLSPKRATATTVSLSVPKAVQGESLFTAAVFTFPQSFARCAG